MRAFHDAGIPEDLVALAPLEDGEVSRHLVTHKDVDRVVLTGSYDTARLFRSWKPDMHLLGETSGKNAIIVTPSADHDIAVRDAVYSAFAHAGQKCSASSLLVLVSSAGSPSASPASSWTPPPPCGCACRCRWTPRWGPSSCPTTRRPCAA